MSLIEKIFSATQSGDLSQPFSVDDLKNWMKKAKVVKDDGNVYALASIDAILSNSDTKNIPTSNKNRKTMYSQVTKGGKHEYWF
jgi:2C-methyl-D-erythritol 2,4-cyclodiphosphate synthase